MPDELELPPFPDVQKGRTKFGSCLRMGFTIGEWQDKLYHHAKLGEWFPARENANGILRTEDQIGLHCGVDVRRAKHYMNKILDAIERKDSRSVEDLISEHDTEILSAIETAKKKCSCDL